MSGTTFEYFTFVSISCSEKNIRLINWDKVDERDWVVSMLCTSQLEECMRAGSENIVLSTFFRQVTGWVPIAKNTLCIFFLSFREKGKLSIMKCNLCVESTMIFVCTYFFVSWLLLKNAAVSLRIPVKCSQNPLHGMWRNKPINFVMMGSEKNVLDVHACAVQIYS